MKSFAYRCGCELGTIIRPNVPGRVMPQEQIRKCFQDGLLILPRLSADRQTLPRVLVDDGQHAKRSAIMRSIHDEVVGPDMVPVLRSTTHTRAVIQPQATPIRLFLWHFPPLAAPDALRTFVINVPALMME